MAAKGGVQAETFSVLGSVPLNMCHLPLIQTLQTFSADSWTTPLSCCLLTTKHHSSPDGLNFTFYTLNVRRHLASVHHPDSSHNHRLGCHQVSLNSFFRYVEPASLLSRRKARCRQVRSFLLLFTASSPSSLSSLMYLGVKMCLIVFYQACNRVCMRC